jgi:hypothetical protein
VLCCTLLSRFAKRARRANFQLPRRHAVRRRLRCDLGPETSTNTAPQLQGELAIPVPEYRHPHATNNGASSRDAPGPTNSPTLPFRPRIGAAERRPHSCSAHQHGTDGGHGMGHMPQDSHTSHRHGAPVRAQRARPHLQRCACGVDGPGASDDGPPGHLPCTHASQACRARARTTRHTRICNDAPVLNEAPTPDPEAPCAATTVTTAGTAKRSPHARTRWCKHPVPSLPRPPRSTAHRVMSSPACPVEQSLWLRLASSPAPGRRLRLLVPSKSKRQMLSARDRATAYK